MGMLDSSNRIFVFFIDVLLLYRLYRPIYDSPPSHTRTSVEKKHRVTRCDGKLCDQMTRSMTDIDHVVFIGPYS